MPAEGVAAAVWGRVGEAPLILTAFGQSGNDNSSSDDDDDLLNNSSDGTAKMPI